MIRIYLFRIADLNQKVEEEKFRETNSINVITKKRCDKITIVNNTKGLP